MQMHVCMECKGQPFCFDVIQSKLIYSVLNTVIVHMILVHVLSIHTTH